MIKRICNMCGKDFGVPDIQNGFGIFTDKIGYGSKYDGDQLSLDLCCECTDKIIDMCKVNPITEYEDYFVF